MERHVPVNFSTHTARRTVPAGTIPAQCLLRSYTEQHRAVHEVRFFLAAAAQRPARTGFCSMLSFIWDTFDYIFSAISFLQIIACLE
jgi:hypothetical protein